MLTLWQQLSDACSRAARYALVAFILSVACAPTAFSADVIYLAGAERESLRKLVQEGVTQVLGDTVELDRYSADAPDDALVLALGPSALSEVLANNPEQPVVSLFASSTFFRERVSAEQSVTAVFNDPPLLRQARLGRLILPRARTIGLLASPDQADAYRPAIESLEAIGLEARVFVVPSPDQLIRHLSRALSYGDFLLGTPDEQIYNRNTIKHLLLTSYRQNRLVIGPTRPYVRAGALASTYTNAADQVTQGLEAVAHYFEHGELPEAAHAREFSVTVNRQVARSMNIPIPSDEQLADELRQLEAADEH